ncbi:unnamed protein product [Gulo gulo]|uniref:Uncharacterized protein n=1 Tax=Gulo gulo TaxID=48420 RepID=A0A9X9LLD2_GULGU|nr:unnamed protein product [Gulo gulo]
MSSSDKCTQPTCHMCSTRAGAPNSQSESRPNPATRWSGPACRDRTTLPKKSDFPGGFPTPARPSSPWPGPTWRVSATMSSSPWRCPSTHSSCQI